MSKITNDGLTRSVTACFITVPIWQQWASKSYNYWNGSEHRGRTSCTASRMERLWTVRRNWTGQAAASAGRRRCLERRAPAASKTCLDVASASPRASSAAPCTRRAGRRRVGTPCPTHCTAGSWWRSWRRRNVVWSSERALGDDRAHTTDRRSTWRTRRREQRDWECWV